MAFTSNVTQGDLLVVVAGSLDIQAANNSFSISDSQGNAYSSVSGVVNGFAVSCGQAQAFYAAAKSTGANTVTLTTDSTTPQLAIHEVAAVSALDKQASAVGSGNAQDSGPVTTTVADEFIFAYTLLVVSGSLSAFSVGAGYTQAEVITGHLLTEYQVAASTGTFDGTTTTTVAKGSVANWATQIATFSAAAAVVTPCTLMTMNAGS